MSEQTCASCKFWGTTSEGPEVLKWGQCFLTYQHLGSQVLESTMRILVEGNHISRDRVLETASHHYCNQYQGNGLDQAEAKIQ